MIDVHNVTGALVLIVDDNPQNIQVLGKILASNEYNIAIAKSGKQAITTAKLKKPDLILLDVMMPEMDGFEACRIIKQDTELLNIPIMFLTAKTEINSKIKGFEVGAVDYITKPFEALEVLKRVETHLKLKKAMDFLKNNNVELEAMLEKRTRELIMAERHSAFSLLIQGIIHNFKNVLTGIFGYGEMVVMGLEDLQKKLEKGASIDEVKILVDRFVPFSKVVLKRAKDLNGMVNSMMIKSRLDKSKEIDKIDLNQVIERELDFYNANMFFKHKVTKSVQLSEKSVYINIVPGEISQVFQNLLGNSIDALASVKDPQIEIKSGQDEKKAWFSVKDNGVGIPFEKQKNIFDPFFTTKNEQTTDEQSKGTGLGLYITLETVKSYDGEIVFESAPGEGTFFKIILPVNG